MGQSTTNTLVAGGRSIRCTCKALRPADDDIAEELAAKQSWYSLLKSFPSH